MHTQQLKPRRTSQRLVAIWTALATVVLGPGSVQPVQAAALASAPQVLLAITNSESMDGTTSGAIMVGSGKLGAAGDASLTSSASPINYTIPTGFTPPLNAGALGQAPYTVSCGSALCDNGPSRLNLAKNAIKQVLINYGDAMNFGLYTYKTGAPTLYTTWVYQMSPAGGFTFTNTYVDEASTPANPCFQYTNASNTVKANCTDIAKLYINSNFSSAPYMNISLSSDAPSVNDVLYAGGGLPSISVGYGGTTPPTPFPPNRSLANYTAGGITITYGQALPANGIRQTGPTNAGYVPFSPQVMYAKRGFGYGASQEGWTGSAAVPMTGNTASFDNSLAPETNNAATAEIKSVAGQSAIGGLMQGALSYMNSLTKANCQKQYVVLLTDGLPTMDISGKPWPPLGSLSGNNYGVTATFNTDGSLGSTNNQALTDAITAINNLSAAGIKTYVIGLGAGVNSSANPMAAKTLQAMAIAGGTANFYPASDAPALNNAFLTIAQQIYQSSSVSAPVAPLTVQSGSAFLYTLTSNPQATQQAGYARAFSVAPDGTPAGTASWEAGALMNVANRSSALRSTASNNSIVTLGNMDAAAFNLTPSTCVPNVSTIVKYTINPSDQTGPCSYLGSRLSGSFLGTFSTQNTGRHVAPPGSSSLINASGYASYASSMTTRPGMLMFTSNDGFLYAVNATSGALMWGWTPRKVLAQMQAYNTFASTSQLDGNFTVVDAPDASNGWASYVVGSMRSGATHFSLKLDASGMPSSQVYAQDVAGGSSPGDKAGTVGATPLRQVPQIVNIGGSMFAVYVVNVGSNSTLYEINVATGAMTSGAISATVSSALYVDPQKKRLWLGSTAGGIWSTPLTGNASVDASVGQLMASTLNPSNSGAAVTPILYVGYTESKGIPYMYAANTSMITLYGIATTGWTPIWASTPSTGYRYASGTFASSPSVSTMTPGGVISDLPRIDGSTMTVPMFSPPVNACGSGSGYYDFFDITTGMFPEKPFTYAGVAVTGRMYVGSGPAFTASVSVSSIGLTFNGNSQGNTGAPGKPMTKQSGTSPIAWRHR